MQGGYADRHLVSMEVARTRRVRIDYRELAGVNEILPRLPRKTKSQSMNRGSDGDDAFYLVDRNGTRVLVHYVGYDSNFDEWQEEDDVVDMPSPCSITNESYDLHQDLAMKIKSTLTGKRKLNPIVRVDMTIDKQTFCQGLQCKGTVSRTVKGVVYYKISSYKELDELLGHNWHYSGTNGAGDFCYIILNTVEYHLYQRKPVCSR